MAGSVALTEPELIEPKRSTRLRVKLRWCIVRGDITGGCGGGPEHGIMWLWPRLRDVSDSQVHTAVKAVMPADVLDNHGLFGAVHDTGEKAGYLDLHRLSAIDDMALRLAASGQNLALWHAKRYEGAEPLSISDREWTALIAPGR